MKSFLMLALALGMLPLDGASLKLVGDLTWKLTEPRCTFSLDGGIQNIGQSGINSGTIRLVLWATPAPFPSAGYIVGDHTLGQIAGGYQFSDFTVRTVSNIPDITGNYYFTIAVLEYTGAGWLTRIAVPTGRKNLRRGDFTDQEFWPLPDDGITRPPARLKYADKLVLTAKATGELNLLPSEEQVGCTIVIRNSRKAKVAQFSKNNPAVFDYLVKRGTLDGRRVWLAKLVLDFDAAGKNSPVSKSVITLYFKGAGSGIYKSTDLDSFGKLITWGTFEFR